MSWLLLAVVAAALGVLARPWERRFLAGRDLSQWQRRMAGQLLRVSVWLFVLACVLRGFADLLGQTAFAQEATQTAYTTSHPGRNYPWLGLATTDGRYEVLLGDGCAQIGPDMNVMLERSDDTNEAQWTLQLPAGDLVCNVAEWHWQGNTPCTQNDTGECDVEDA